MRRIVLLWLVLTPLWIAFSFYGSTAKIAFIPPALVVIVLVLYWLHRHFVIAVAGEPEPRARSVRPNPWPRRNLQTPAVAAPAIMAPPVTAPPVTAPAVTAPAVAAPVVRAPVASAPLPGLFRPALIAVGVGACIGGAAVAFFHLNRPVSIYRAAAHVTQNAAAGVQTEAVKTQSFAAEPNAAPTESMKSRSLAIDAKMQDSSDPAHNADGKRAEAQFTTSDQMSPSEPRCNLSLCESSYQSFRASDCTYQPYSGPRQYCAR
jgi:hypothetical protein